MAEQERCPSLLWKHIRLRVSDETARSRHHVLVYSAQERERGLGGRGGLLPGSAGVGMPDGRGCRRTSLFVHKCAVSGADPGSFRGLEGPQEEPRPPLPQMMV